MLQCVAMCCSVLGLDVVQGQWSLESVLQRVAVCCSVLQCVAMCCSKTRSVESVLQRVALCWGVLQCVAVRLKVLASCNENGFERAL